jgi:tetratricopeptide (TPR) repeat protein
MLKMTKRIQFEDFAAYTRACAEKALALDPDIRGVHETLGKCLVQQAEREPLHPEKFRILAEAFGHFKAEKEQDPDNPECHKALGFLHRVFGQPKDAIREYKKYLTLAEERDYDVQSELGRLLVTQEDSDEKTRAEGLALIENSYRFDPNELRYCRNYSDALYLFGRLEEAIEVLQHMIEIDPVSVEVYRNRIESFREFQERLEKDDADSQE